MTEAKNGRWEIENGGFRREGALAIFLDPFPDLLF